MNLELRTHRRPRASAETRNGDEELGVDAACGLPRADEAYKVFEVEASVAMAMDGRGAMAWRWPTNAQFLNAPARMDGWMDG
jgi:hypothetical protein